MIGEAAAVVDAKVADTEDSDGEVAGVGARPNVADDVGFDVASAKCEQKMIALAEYSSCDSSMLRQVMWIKLALQWNP